MNNYHNLCTNNLVQKLRGWLHGEISARPEISSRLLAYGKERNNLNKKGTFRNPHISFLIQIISLFSIRQQPGWNLTRAEISPCNQPLSFYSLVRRHYRQVIISDPLLTISVMIWISIMSLYCTVLMLTLFSPMFFRNFFRWNYIKIWQTLCHGLSDSNLRLLRIIVIWRLRLL